MSGIPPTRRIDEPPSQDGAPLAGWPTTIPSEQAAALQTALKQFQIALDAVVRERDDLLAEVERLRADAERFRWLARQTDMRIATDGTLWRSVGTGESFICWGYMSVNGRAYPAAATLAKLVDIARKDQEDGR